jgi:type I restriction enzyme, S subunit
MNNEAKELLERHFDLAFSAPNGVKKLRELILTFAMQGKLVPQDPNDQPASELLKEIKAKKRRLVEEGKTKAQNPLPEINSEEIPYVLPKGWKWCRWNEIALKIGDVDHKMPVEISHGVPYVSPRDFFGKNEIDFEQAKKISIEDFEALRLKIKPEKFDIIFPRYGTLGVNRLVLMDIDFLASYSCAVIKNFNGFIDPKYSYYYSISQLARTEIERYTKKTTQANVGVKSIQLFLYPLPPLAEQHRIVAKIDRLMAQCDELGNLGSDRNQKRITIHTAAIDRLLAAQADSDFSTAWDFIQQHFGELYSVKENVAELRKAILQLAVMGKLVPQTSVFQVASLGSILAEASANGIAKGPTSNTSATEILRISAGTSRRDFYVNEDDFKHVALSTSEIQKFQLAPGDLLACRFNGNLHYVGRFSYYRGESKRIQVNPDKLIRFRIDTKFHCPRYVCYAMNAAPIRRAIEAMCATTAGNIGLSAGKLKTVGIPLPSLAEQHCIVAKIDQLMTLCDRLEQQIDAATSKRNELLNALTAQV